MPLEEIPVFLTIDQLNKIEKDFDKIKRSASFEEKLGKEIKRLNQQFPEFFSQDKCVANLNPNMAITKIFGLDGKGMSFADIHSKLSMSSVYKDIYQCLASDSGEVAINPKAVQYSAYKTIDIYIKYEAVKCKAPMAIISQSLASLQSQAHSLQGQQPTF